MIVHMESELERLSESNTLIFGTRRSKRAVLDFVGNIAGDVFGVLGSNFAEKYGEDISKVTKNENHLLKLLANHTSILETTLNVLRKDEVEIKKQSENFDNLMKFATQHSEELEKHQFFSDAMIYLTMIINEYEQQQESILRILSESNRNVISHTLFTPSQMEK